VASLSSSVNKASSSFAPVGITSPFTGDLYAIKIYDPDTSQELWNDHAAHFGVIYDLKSVLFPLSSLVFFLCLTLSDLYRWSTGDAYLLSCSSDGQSKIWKYLEAEGGSKQISFSPHDITWLIPPSLTLCHSLDFVGSKRKRSIRISSSLFQVLPSLFCLLPLTPAAGPHPSPLASSLHILRHLPGYPTLLTSCPHLS
jgi:WD40 repeat protein